MFKLERIKLGIAKIGNVGCGMMLEQSCTSLINSKLADGHNKQDLFEIFWYILDKIKENFQG